MVGGVVRAHFSNNTLIADLVYSLALHKSIQEPPGITIGEIQEMGMVDDSVKESGGNFGVSEYVVPASKLKIGSDDKRLSFITFRNDLEE